MKSRRRLAVILTVASLLSAATSPAPASASSLVAYWPMNDRAGSRIMTDASGNRHHGSVGAEVGTGVKISGAVGFRFPRLEPDTPPTHPAHLVTVPDSGALDPGDRDYAVTIRLRTTDHFGNIIQKGQATVSGGNFKMQIPNGIAQCYFRGSSHTLLAQSTRQLNDGAWHVVRCERTSDALIMTVDGRTVARTPGWTGRITNSWPVTIGGKVSCDQRHVGCDYFAGDLDYAAITAH